MKKRARYTRAEIDALGATEHAQRGADGSYTFSYEKRDTANDVFATLDGAVADACQGRFDSWSVWVQDWYGSSDGGENAYTVVFRAGGDLWQAPFDYDDDGKVTLGEMVKVRPSTSYIERDNNSKPESRVSLTNTVELRKSRLPKRGEREVRTLPIEKLEVREDDDRNTLTLSGYASVFNRRYSVGLYEEEIAPGAFKRSLSNPNLDCVLRVEHDGLPIARTSSGTLRLAEDAEGLRVEADLDPTDPDVQRLVPKYRRGDLREMSFAFRCNDDVWSEDYSSRTVRSAEIHRGDVSIVTYGASPTTNSTLRSEAALQELRNVGEGPLVGALQDFAAQWVANYWAEHGERAARELVEKRVGAKFSGQSTETLMRVLNLVASADDAVDEAQPLLADLMGVPNPDDDDDGGEDGERAAPEQAETTRTTQLPSFRGDEFLLELRALEGRR